MFTWSKYPLLRILGAYLTGILLFFSFRNTIQIPIFSGLIITTLGIVIVFLSHYFISYKNRIVTGSIIIILLIWMGGFSTCIYTTMHKPPTSVLNSTKNILCIGDVKESPMIKTNSVKLIIHVVQYSNSVDLQKANFDMILFVKKDEKAEQIKYGDRLVFYTQTHPINEPKNPQEFNYKRYLEIKTIHLQGYVSNEKWQLLAEKKGNQIMIFASQLRQKFLLILNKSNLGREENAVVSAILLGADDKLDASLAKRYASAGVSHILCVSGMHVGIIFMIINYLLFFLSKNKRQKIIKTIILLFAIWLYACITGMSPSVMRATTMFTFVSFGNIFKRNVNTYNSLLTSFFFLSCFNPLLVYEVGMQLSYAAVVGIVWLQKPIKNIYQTRTKVGNYIFEIMAVSIAAQLLTCPLSMYYFHQFPNYFLLANIAVITFTPFIVGTGILTLVLSFWEWAYDYISILLNYLIKSMNYIVTFIESLPFSTWQNIYLNPWQAVLFYGAILFFAFALMYKKRTHVFVSLISLILMLSVGISHEISNQQKKEIVFYSIPQGFLIDCIDGETTYVIGDSTTLNDSIKTSFYVQNYRIKRAIKNIIVMENNDKNILFKSGNFIYFQGKNIFIVNNKIYFENTTPQRLTINYLLIDANPQLKIKNLIKMIDPEIIIFTANNSKYKISKWEKECDSLQITHYSLSNESLQIRL